MVSRPSWVRPSSVDEACELMAGDPGGRLVAGCTQLTPRSIVGDGVTLAIDVLGLEELDAVEDRGDRVWVGAARPLAALAGNESLGPLASCALRVGDEVLRQHATVGGNIAAGAGAPRDLATVLIALDASVELAEVGSRSTLPLTEIYERDFGLGFSAAIVGVELPRPTSPWGYRKLTTNASSYGVGSIACYRGPAGARVVANPGTGLPRRLTGMEEALDIGAGPTELRAAGVDDLATIDARDDHLGSARYRRYALVEVAMAAIDATGEAG